LLKASPEKTVELSFPSKHLGCTHSREQWAQRTVHCAASLRDAAKKGYSRLETTGRGLGMRWKHPSAARVANDPQGREWVPSRPLGWPQPSAGQKYFQSGRVCSGRVQWAASRNTATNAKLRRVTAAKVREVYVQRDGETDQRTGTHSDRSH
jgi:hypothetical protein